MEGLALTAKAKPTSRHPCRSEKAEVQSLPLAGLRIAITRPAMQAIPLIERIRAAGGEALALPLLEIAPATSPITPDALRTMVDRADRIIFISPNAVHTALTLLPAEAWPSDRLFAIGKGTARILREAGFTDVLTPNDGANSEALLALPEFQNVREQTILIVRGEGGRDLLAKTLEARGARLSHAPVYRRIPLAPDMSELIKHAPLVFLITSSEALRILYAAAERSNASGWLRQQGFVFGHPRIAETGRAFGLIHGIITASPENDALYAALVSPENLGVLCHDRRTHHA